MVLEKLKVSEVEQILYRAMGHLGVCPHTDREVTTTDMVVTNMAK